MSHLAIAMLASMVICEAEDETADMTFAGLLRGAEKTCQLKNPGRIPVWELPLVVVLVTAWKWKMFTQHTHTSSSRFLIIIIIITINRGIPLYLRQQWTAAWLNLEHKTDQKSYQMSLWKINLLKLVDQLQSCHRGVRQWVALWY